MRCCLVRSCLVAGPGGHGWEIYSQIVYLYNRTGGAGRCMLPPMEIPIENDRFCFCCGPDNPHGLHLAIDYPAKGMAEASLVVDPRYAGWQGITPGGVRS